MSSFAPEPDAEAPAGTPMLMKHDRVRHPEFGRGYVAEVRGENCLVFFLEDGQRRLLKQAKLEPCS